MVRLLAFVLAAAALPWAASEPQARKAVQAPMRLDGALAHVSAAAELPDGRIVVSDVRAPAVWLIDPATGGMARLGSAGVNADQYVQPGGLYGGTGGGLLLLDRAQLRVMAIDPAGTFASSYSIAIKGTTMSTSDDADQQRLDARGYAYFSDRGASLSRRARGESAETVPLLRFDPVSQASVPVAELGQPETRFADRGGGLTVSRAVIGSPADGWGVAPDGSVAIVRGSPYRVDWIGPGGAVTKGPVIEVDPIPMTDADKAAFTSTAGGGASVGARATTGGGDAGGLSGLEPEFAATKAPFAPADVVVSPDRQVWVQRSRPAGATTVIYDVFDRRGRRIDRLEFPDGNRVVGFGRGVVYVRQQTAGGTTTLGRFERK